MNTASLSQQNRCVFDGPNYRYVLAAKYPWSTETRKGKIAWIMLNPSTANEQKLDPTLTRCFRWMAAWGFEEMVILNLFAYRTSNPKIMFAAGKNAIGDSNNFHIAKEIADAAKIVCAWGANVAPDHPRVLTVLDLLRGRELYCLGMTKNGSPIHPLARGKARVPDNVQLQRFNL